jgi:predicted tellurium resistance membrane protein TerC
MFVAHTLDALLDPLTIAIPILAGLFVRNPGLLTVGVLVWLMIAEAIVARTTNDHGFIVNHGAIFFGRMLASALVAASVWSVVTLCRRRDKPPTPPSAP